MAERSRCRCLRLRSIRANFSPEHVSFACCHGSGRENHAKYGDSIYFHSGGSDLYVILFISSELTWKANGLVVRQPPPGI